MPFDAYPFNAFAVLVVTIAALVVVDRWRPSERAWKRLIVGAAAVSLVVAILLLVAQLPYSPRLVWSGGRLAPAIGWVKGYQLYYPPEQGPVMVQMYGPMSAIVYTAAAAGSNPTQAVMMGTFINLALYILPALGFLIAAGRSRRGVGFVGSVAIFAMISARQGVLAEAATRVTIDAPAAGFAALAMALLVWARPDRPWRNGFLCGLSIALSVWCKLTFAPVGLAAAGYALMAYPARDAARFIAAMILMGLAISGVFVGWFGMELIVQNIVIPSRQPWQWSSNPAVVAYLKAIVSLVGYMQPLIWIGVVVLVLLGRGDGKGDWREWARSNPWVLPAMAAIVVMPASALAGVKIGGAWNNAVGVAFFILLAVASLLGRRVEEGLVNPHSFSQRLARVLTIGLCLSGCWLTPSMLSQMREGLATWSRLHENDNEAIFRYASAHSGEVWAPSYPLATLLADGRLYHFAAGIDSSGWGGHPLSDEHFREWLPERLRIVLSRPPRPEPAAERLREFDQTESIPEMPGWLARTRHSVMRD